MPSHSTAPRKPRKSRAKAAPALGSELLPDLETPPPAAGSNMPPEPIVEKTPLELMTEAVDDLYLEAANWLDGDPISNEEQAGRLTELKGRLQEAVKTVEVERKKLADPLYQEWTAINKAWKPISTKAEKAVGVAQRALTPWLVAVAAENKRLADAAAAERQKAEDELRAKRDAAARTSSLADEDAVEDAEAALKQATKDANVAKRETATVRTDYGKAHLRTYWFVEVLPKPGSYKLLLEHYMRTDRDWLYELLRERAQRDVNGGTRSLPGCRIWDEQRAI